MSATFDGGCLCGAVRYRVTGPLTDSGYCHCRMCQKWAGAPVQAWFTAPLASFAWVKGAPKIYRSSEKAQREFCGECGSSLVFRGIGADKVDISTASLDEPARVPPEYHIWRMSRIPWFETADDLPRHDARGPDWSPP